MIQHHESLPDEDLLRAFVGDNADYYVQRWRQLAATGRMSTGFNVAAFFTSGCWLLYRKMYLAATILFGIILLETIVEEVIPRKVPGAVQPPPQVSLLVALTVAVVVGWYGTYWYHRRALGKIAIAKARFPDRNAQIGFLRKCGGGSVPAIILGASALVVACTMASMLVVKVLGLSGGQ